MKILTWGICLVVFCLPLYLARFSVLAIPTTVLELMIYALFVFWLLDKLIRNTKYEIRTTRLLFVPIILILIGVTLATVFSSDPRTSAGIWKAWFIDPLLLFIVLISSIKNSEQIKKVFYSLFLSGTIVSVISLVYLIQGKLDPVGRLQAFYNSPNYLAMYLAPALIIGVGYYLFIFLASPSEACSGMSPSLPRSCVGDHARFGLITHKKIIPSAFILLFVVCLLLSIIFTHSYGAWLGIIVAIGFASLRLVTRRARLLLLALILLLVLFLGYFALMHRESSFDARLIIWQNTWQIFKNNPILGIGPGTLGNYFSPYPEWGVPQPHNIYLAFLLQTGIIGFIGFIWLLIWFFRPAADQPQAGKLRLLLMMIMVYILVHGLVDTTYWKNDLSVVFWIVVGLMAILSKETITKRQGYKQ